MSSAHRKDRSGAADASGGTATLPRTSPGDETRDRSDTGQAPLLEARDVRKTYRMGRVEVPVLRGASITIREGEWVAILGASGSGKSTLLHLLGDLDHDDDRTHPRSRPADTPRGDLRFMGRSIRSMSLVERNRYRNETVGFVFQFYHLLPELNVLENALLPAAVRTTLRSGWHWALVAAIGGIAGAIIGPLVAHFLGFEIADNSRALALVIGAGAIAGAALLPLGIVELRSIRGRFGAARARMVERATELLTGFGLGHRLRHRPRELSGGERQRVAIARALMNRPRVLLADEPTGNLDERTGREILDLLAEQHRQGMTIVMVTHDPAVAARADRQVHLRDGVVVDG